MAPLERLPNANLDVGYSMGVLHQSDDRMDRNERRHADPTQRRHLRGSAAPPSLALRPVRGPLQHLLPGPRQVPGAEPSSLSSATR
jgi:hypothetical protein